MDQSCTHALFVEEVTDDGHVIMRNSWGDTMARIRLQKDDKIIKAIFRIKLKKIVMRSLKGRNQDPELFDESKPDEALQWPEAVRYPVEPPKELQNLLK